ncbi:MAG: 1-acyl-sn-glycerol-3-phosphate acyltransferase [Methylophaga sp.]|nr:1-acyl-sn-glycerol-3-phosphate acyltransferase [Methylophaga sp.]
MLIVRSAIFVVLHIITAIFFSFISIFVWPFPFKIRYRVMTRWAQLNLWLLAIICRIEYRVTGLENIPDGPSVILCKHQSSWETLALQSIFPPQVWVLKRELLWLPFFGWGLACLNPIAIDRKAGKKALQQVIDQGKQRLDSGKCVVVFPEGTRVPIGQMGRFGIGGARLATETGYPAIPVAHDAGKVWPRHGFIKYPGMINMVVGKPINTEGKTATQVNRILQDWMIEQMTNLEGAPPKVKDKTQEDH